MVSKDKLIEIAHRVLEEAKKQGAEHSQVRIFDNFSIGTRFGENHITQNVTTKTQSFELKTQIGQKIGVYNGSRIGENLASQVNDAITLTKLSIDDPEFPGFLNTQPNYQPMGSGYKEIDPTELSEVVGDIVDAATKVDSRIKSVAGNLHYLTGNTLLLNSYDVLAYNSSSKISGVITVAADEDGESRSTKNIAGNTISDLESVKMAELTARTAIQGLHQKEIEAGKYEVILGPEAVAQLLLFVSFGASSEGLINHTSYLKDRLGEQIMDERITIIDDCLNEAHFASRNFDSEGVACETLKFVEKGVLKDYAYNLRNAKKLGVKSNGRNASGFQGEMPAFFSLTIEKGEKSAEELVKSVDNGVLVTNLFYNNFVNAPEGLCTGLTKDGLFKVENGEVTDSLKNMRWTDKILSILGNAEPGSDSRQVKGFFFGSAIIPSIKVEQFNFSSKGKH
ncbi:MAG: TldD/PmbA family protein [Candidatus Heimdallarchaeota archaeon]